jgi:hypothetical protein
MGRACNSWPSQDANMQMPIFFINSQTRSVLLMMSSPLRWCKRQRG